MRQVVIQTVEPVLTKEDTERLVKFLNSTYAKFGIEQVANNTTHMKAE